MTDLPGYELDAPRAQEWTDKAFDMLEAGTMQASATVQHDIAKLFVEGPCPRCGPHRVRTNQIETIVAAGAGMKILEAVRDVADESDANYSTRTISCNCGEPHPGGPQGSDGCGISFNVTVLREVVG